MDAESLPISALQHFLYCPRQCALIHLEQQWSENLFTAEGRLLHERVDEPAHARRGNIRCVTALEVSYPEMGIHGVADVVEFHRTDEGERPYPVEYKRGKPKAHWADEVQLCAQAMCLEAMFGHTVREGALFYGRTRRRKTVAMSAELRELTLAAIDGLKSLWQSQRTPPATYDRKRCGACSLLDLCQPEWLGRTMSVRSWLQSQLVR